jgi:hypothetical protein
MTFNLTKLQQNLSTKDTLRTEKCCPKFKGLQITEVKLNLKSTNLGLKSGVHSREVFSWQRCLPRERFYSIGYFNKNVQFGFWEPGLKQEITLVDLVPRSLTGNFY